MFKFFLFAYFFLSGFFINAQYSLNGGLSTLNAFGQKSYMGFHLGGEFPKSNDLSMYLRASFYGKREADPFTQGSYFIQLDNINPLDAVTFVKATSTFNYTTFDGGMRYYILDGYDDGFALYGGTNVMGAINSAKFKLDSFDDTKYRVPGTTSLSGTILNVGVGLSGGAKYTFPGIGSIYFDSTVDYLIISKASNSTAQNIGGQFFSSILFSFNIGFRRDFY